MLAQVLLLELGEVRLVSSKFGDAWPFIRSRSASNLEYFRELVFLIFAREQWSFGYDLCEDASHRPDVDRGVVVLGAHEDIWSSVPKGDYLMGEVFHRNSKGTSQPEICQLQNTLAIDEQVLRLQISMEYLVLVALGSSVEQLIQERFDLFLRKGSFVVVKQLLQILIEEFEDERELFVGVQHVDQSDDVWVL